MLPECLPELPALATLLLWLRLAVVPRQPLATLLESNSHGQQKKEKTKVDTSMASVAEHHLVHTIRTQDESIQKKTSHMFGTHKNVPARANPVCAVHRPCLLKDRKRAGMSRSGTSRATQHGWSSSAASGAASLVAKNPGSQ